jgi:hypothetical protein
MHLAFLFPRRKSVHNLVCGVCEVCRMYFYQPSFRDGTYLHMASYRWLELIDGWNLYVFLANATMSIYLNGKTSSLLLLFVSAILINSVQKSVIYCSCSSLGKRPRNGLIAFMESDIKKNTQAY